MKRLHACDGAAYERFRREVQVLAELSHPAIVGYVGHGRTADRPYVAIEWVDGETLAERLQREELTIPESVALVRRVAEALGLAHERGVVHRDVKPSNILLPEGLPERAKLIDFGVARSSWVDVTLTTAGLVVGTPGYMAPEQARGSSAVDARADVFALGCVLYRCLTGRRAFEGADLQAVLAKIVLADPPTPRTLLRGIPIDLDALVTRMLDKSPDRRPRDGAEVAALLAALGPIDVIARPTSIPPALTAEENRLVSVVSFAPGAHDALSFEHEPWARVALSFGARLERLADGSVIAALSGRGGATEQASMAARCALALRAELGRCPMALATGRGAAGQRERVGEAIDRAAQMLRGLRWGGAGEPPTTRRGEPSSRGRAGPIAIDEVTAALLDARFDVAAGSPEGPRELRGERAPGSPRPLLGVPTPCVGRDRELATLEAIFEECAGEPAGRIALVTAPAGMGKSRLTLELLRRLRELDPAPDVWIARADPLSAGSPFGLLAQVVRRAADIADGAPLALRRAALRAYVARVVRAPDVDRVSSFLGELAGLHAGADASSDVLLARHEPALLGEQMRRAWIDLLRGACAAGPIVLVLEDLQWGDLPTVTAIDRALKDLGALPCMVLAVARPEVHEVFPDLWSARDVQEIRLVGLSRRAAQRLVRLALGHEVDTEVVERLVARAEGNAFFLEELIRAVADPERRDAVPETVLAVVEARLERLEVEARRVLRAASVFGQTFWRAGVRALAGDDETDAWIDLLILRELVAESTESRFGAETELVFRHAFVREAAYRTLTPADRALGHRLAAAWLEAAGETEAMTLAEHHDRGDEPARAVPFYLTLAEEALAGNDFGGAVERAECAIRRGAIGVVAGAARRVQAEAHRWTGETRAAAERAAEAVALLRRGSAEWFASVYELSAACGRLGDYDGLESALVDAARCEATPGAEAARVAALCPGTAQLLQAGRHTIAATLAIRIEALAAPPVALDARASARLDQLRGFRALREGEPALARARYASAIAAFERAGSLRNVLVEKVNHAFASAELGAFEEAEATLREVLANEESASLHAVRAYANLNLGRVLMQLGRLQDARSAELAALAIGQSERSPRIEGAARIHLANIAQGAGDARAAEDEARAALELLTPLPPLRAAALAALARAVADGGKIAEAVALSEEAHTIVEQTGGELFDTFVRLTRAEILARAGDRVAARAAARAAAELVEGRAARIEDPSLRERFLGRVQDNARTLALARTLNASSGSRRP